MIVTRRSFVIGALASFVTVHLLPDQAPLVLRREPARYYEFAFEYDIPQDHHAAVRALAKMTPCAVSLHRVGGTGAGATPLLHFAVRPGAQIRWIAVPGNEIVTIPRMPMRLDVDPPLGNPMIFYFGYHTADDEIWHEKIWWPSGKREIQRLIRNPVSILEYEHLPDDNDTQV